MTEFHPIFLTNTLGRRLEEFESIEPGMVRMYTCGPTVYHYAHIGNFRAFIVADTLRRVLEYNDYRVVQVRNITDVGHLTNDTVSTGADKIEESARKSNTSPWDIAQYFTEAFYRDAERLNIEEPEHSPRATEFIEPMIRLVERLVERGSGYPSAGNVYFDVSTFPAYGKLSGNSTDDLIAGARVEVGEGKRSPADFALWKSADPDKIMRWDSPWGTGVPGWHLECSAMAIHLLGEEIDIHTGGEDHVFPHHEDEIAQSEAATGKRFARYWLHNAFLQLADSEKMSKSLGNTDTISDLVERGFHPLSYRYFTFQAHYRTPLSFSWEALEAAQTALVRLWDAAAEMTQSACVGEIDSESGTYRRRFHEAINRDLDMPGAVALLHEVVASKIPVETKLALMQDFDRVFALDLIGMGRDLSRISPRERELLDRRAEARAARNWAESDALRAQLLEGGLEVKDTPQGQRWVRKDFLPQGQRDDPEDTSQDQAKAEAAYGAEAES